MIRRAVRVLLGILAAGLASGVVGAVVIVVPMAFSPDADLGWLSALMIFSLVLTIYGWAATVVLGLPAHVALGRLGVRNIQAYLIAGAVAGALFALVHSLSSGLFHPTVLAAGVAAGIAGAAAFWLVRRPDRDAVNRPATSADGHP